MVKQDVSLVASWEKDLEKPVNAKRKEITTASEVLTAPAYRTWKEKRYVNGKKPEKKIYF